MTAKEKQAKMNRITAVADYRRHICELKAQIAMDEREIAGILLEEELEQLDKK